MSTDFPEFTSIDYDSIAEKWGYKSFVAFMKDKIALTRMEQLRGKWSIQRFAKTIGLTPPTVAARMRDGGLVLQRGVGAPPQNANTRSINWDFYKDLGFASEKQMWNYFREEQNLKGWQIVEVLNIISYKQSWRPSNGFHLTVVSHRLTSKGFGRQWLNQYGKQRIREVAAEFRKIIKEGSK